MVRTSRDQQLEVQSSRSKKLEMAHMWCSLELGIHSSSIGHMGMAQTLQRRFGWMVHIDRVELLGSNSIQSKQLGLLRILDRSMRAHSSSSIENMEKVLIRFDKF